MKITEFTKMVKHLTELSTTINYYMIDQEFKDFMEWLLYEHGIELDDNFGSHIDLLIENETININDHIYLTIRESIKYIDKLQNKINI